MTVKHMDEIETSNVIGSTGVDKKILISLKEDSNFEMRFFTIHSGGNIPKHTNQVEHKQYVLNGHAEVGIGEEIFEVQKGDIVFIPAKIPHWYINKGNETFEFLCLVPNKPDFMTILE